MNRLHRRLLLLVATVLFTSITWTPSHADTRTKNDPVGDAVAHFDLTSAKYLNARDTIHIELRARNLKGVPTGVMVRFNKRGMGATHFYAAASRYTGGDIYYGLYVRSPGSDQPLRCKQMQVRWSISQDWIRISFPQLCLSEGGYGRQRFTSMIGTYLGWNDTIPRTPVPYR